MRRYEMNVNRIGDLFQNIWKDPFDENELCDLATSVEAADEEKADLFGAYQKGVEAYNVFVEERFVKRTIGFVNANLSEFVTNSDKFVRNCNL